MTLANPTSSLRNYDFTTESPALWSQSLQKIKDKGHVGIRTRVYWGEHESSRGIRDFSKSPRLRIERFLTLAQDIGLNVELEVKLAPSREGFPQWSHELDNQAYVHLGVSDPSLRLLSTPSFYDPDLQEGFLEFLSDLEGIVSLYRYPEGPVQGASLDIRMFLGDQNAFASEDFACFLQMKYQRISNLNRRYQTSFNDFSSVLNGKGWRVMMDRRPWLAFYDYRYCRHSLLKEFRDSFLRHEVVQKVFGDRVHFEVSQSEPKFLDIAMDPVFLETSGAQIYPCTPGGLSCPAGATAYRVWNHLEQESKRQDYTVGFLPDFDSVAVGYRPALVVVGGAYLSSPAFRSLLKYVEEGGTVAFPFGLPKYDENLNYHNWRMSPGRRVLRDQHAELESFHAGRGVIWTGTKPPPVDEKLASRLLQIRDAVSQLDREEQ